MTSLTIEQPRDGPAISRFGSRLGRQGAKAPRGWCDTVSPQVSELPLSGRGTRYYGLRNELGRFAERVWVKDASHRVADRVAGTPRRVVGKSGCGSSCWGA